MVNTRDDEVNNNKLNTDNVLNKTNVEELSVYGADYSEIHHVNTVTTDVISASLDSMAVNAMPNVLAATAMPFSPAATNSSSLDQNTISDVITVNDMPIREVDNHSAPLSSSSSRQQNGTLL